ncbi:7-cyano-7-deazaguanine synthase [Acididesulfobacillus acetoxydans]|uniref:7-cyano-7-deazaguanine synthase n=1 Tax=Acididesulfobacillus acetoxydans TaxID=1561005 RepID=A0A8S0XY03_9FIRM|nr:7-cyano-7-deazaguanine synthase QueC [Acididesulfobacillus acetoxydans]CAA7602007.1 7-cyano-7-deazaguanine synthase [Acididesulfobacillus acetoxydans]CEJ08150.1 7-cyano-7-deazaguanine synthase [Acididesulfobacillus acetoxydans]
MVGLKRAVVLLSGGMDSSTVLYMAKSEGFELHAISFDYGQRHVRELECARAVAQKAGVKEHIVVRTNMDAWGGSALTDKYLEVPENEPDKGRIPITYVPARNMIFLSFAASYAEAIGSQDVFIGVSEVDYSGYVDCRQEFIDAMEKAINMGTVCAVQDGRKISIRTPLIHMTKSAEIKLGIKLGVDYGLTWTCYKGEDLACGTCDSCTLRLKAFREAGYKDPIPYKAVSSGARPFYP